MNEDKATLDVDPLVARALHRVVRAMHDGECPNCHFLFRSDSMQENGPGSMSPGPGDLTCPRCQFTITAHERNAALVAFAPIMEENLKTFETWRATLPPDDGKGHGFDLHQRGLNKSCRR